MRMRPQQFSTLLGRSRADVPPMCPGRRIRPWPRSDQACPPVNGTMTAAFPFLWLCGPMGVGKSSVGWEIFTPGIKTGYADADQLGLCYPVPEDDPVNHRVKSNNLGAVYHNFRDAGARCFIFSGSVYSTEEVHMYKDQIPGTALTICVLDGNPRVIKDRFLRRGWSPHLVDEAISEVAQLAHVTFADLRVDTDDLSVEEVAQRVRAQAGNWPGLTEKVLDGSPGFGTCVRKVP
jgi:hypothetical protein